MNDKDSKNEKIYHYLEMNRGRYFCSDHGSFCDSSDNYLNFCLICGNENSKREKWTVNNISRILQTVNGLQDRSKRNFAVLSGIIGGAGLLRFLSFIGGDKDPLIDKTLFCNFTVGDLLIVPVIFFILSAILYVSSMPQIAVIDENEFPEKTIQKWEKFFTKKLENMENCHKYGGYLFIFGAVILIITLAISIVI